jgi:hypothetical protein
MSVFIVTKAPVGLEGAAEIVGAFSTASQAEAACTGAGTYTIARVTVDRAYKSGTLLDARLFVVANHREFGA